MKLISRLIGGIVTLVALLAGLIVGCTTAPSQPISVRLSFSDMPTLNRPVKLTAAFELDSYSRQEAQNVTAQIILPAGFQKVDGELSWKGNLPRGTTQTLNATVKAVETGIGQVVARADYGVERSYVGGTTSIYVTVYKDGATISDRLPRGSIRNASPQPDLEQTS